VSVVQQRLDPAVFRLPVERMRDGYYSDQYFNLTRDLLIEEGRHPHVLMQVFQKEQSILGGIDEAIAILKQCSGRHVDSGWHDGWGELEVRALEEGNEIAPFETVLTIAGDYALFFRKAGVEITFEGERYHVVPQAAILALVRDED